VEGNNGASTMLQWSAVDSFTTVTQTAATGGQFLNLHNTRQSDIGEYICTDTVSGRNARLNLTTGK